jgi:hypothetical protein
MIDRTGEVWMVDLAQHKNSHKNKSRRIFVGPKAQKALLPFLLENQPNEPIFSPPGSAPSHTRSSVTWEMKTSVSSHSSC